MKNQTLKVSDTKIPTITEKKSRVSLQQQLLSNISYGITQLQWEYKLQQTHKSLWSYTAFEKTTVLKVDLHARVADKKSEAPNQIWHSSLYIKNSHSRTSFLLKPFFYLLFKLTWIGQLSEEAAVCARRLDTNWQTTALTN